MTPTQAPALPASCNLARGNDKAGGNQTLGLSITSSPSAQEIIRVWQHGHANM